MKDELDITKNIRLTQWILADIVSAAAEISKRMATNADSRDVAEAIADVVIKSYMLSDTLGIGYPVIDTKIRELIKRNEGELSKTFDANALLRYLTKKDS